MDEEYDVIVLGTGLTVSAASGVQGAASLSPWDAAAPDPILPSVPARHCSVPEKTAPCPTTVMRPPSLSCPVCREAAPFLAPVSWLFQWQQLFSGWNEAWSFLLFCCLCLIKVLEMFITMYFPFK